MIINIILLFFISFISYSIDEKIKNIPIWFINSANDNVVTPKDFSLPSYQALLKAGAKNAWYSYYESVKGIDVKNLEYLGHFSWTYVLNNKVGGVQDTKKIINSTLVLIKK